MAYRRVNDGKWSLAYVSGGCRELLGVEPEEMTAPGAGGFTNYIHPSYHVRFDDASKALAYGSGSFRLAYVTSHKRGWDRWVFDTGVGVFDSRGKLQYVDGFVSDHSGYKEIQSGMSRQLGEFQDYFRSSRLGDIVGKSPAMQNVFSAIIQVAQSDENVIVYGESGTGKELVAREIHRVSRRAAKPFIPVNCGAIPENLMESELFGYRKGAFSGADKDKQGLFEAAHGGTLFLDEVGEIPLTMQVKLLRALEGDGFTPMGGCEVVKPDLRVVAATNRNLADMVAKGQMRADFYYRINIIPILIPPLRERKEDIPLLVGHFLGQSDENKFIPGSSLKAIMAYDWPGNVRELKNQLRQYRTLGFMDMLHSNADDEPAHNSLASPTAKSLREHLAQCEVEAISAALFQNQWNRTKTANALGIDRRTLFDKIKKMGLDSASG
ncbi:sigma 54-interacting transcriptional regulator [Pseudodesulfovibrio alkaliphilus]|nr:sigma 54-interacting transcriptional regulator [Pseudodesulfovibrio alkaliphilus]